MHCNKCNSDKAVADFYVSNRTTCKECVKQAVRANRREKIDYYRAFDRARGSRTTLESLRKYRAKNPEKYKAHYTVSNAIKRGKLDKLPCERCGSMNVHGHHDDYSKPLDVMWLCPVHHKERHKELEKMK